MPTYPITKEFLKVPLHQSQIKISLLNYKQMWMNSSYNAMGGAIPRKVTNCAFLGES